MWRRCNGALSYSQMVCRFRTGCYGKPIVCCCLAAAAQPAFRASSGVRRTGSAALARETLAMCHPPPADVPDCMAALERFIHAEDDLPVLVRAGLVHVQFETIHPFLDGNGRLGRLLITLMLVDAGVLHQPLLYLSLHFKRHRSTYYDLLDGVRRDGDWEAWLAFFLTGVRETAETAIDVAQRSREIFERDRKRIEETGRRGAGSALRVFDALRARPILTNAGASRATALSFPAASAAMQLLVELGIAEEQRPTRRAKLFLYRDYLRVLTEEKG